MKKIVFILIGAGLGFFLWAYFSYHTYTGAPCLEGELAVVNKLDHTISFKSLSNSGRDTLIDLGIEPHEIQVSLDGEFWIISDYGSSEKKANRLFLVSTKTHKLLKTITTHRHQFLHGIALTEDPNKILVVAESTNNLLLIDLESGQLLREVYTGQLKSHMVVKHPATQIAYVSNMESGSVSIIDYLNNRILNVINCGRGTEGLAINKNGSELWISNRDDNTVLVLNTRTNFIERTLLTDALPVRVALSPDYKFAVVSNFSGKSITVFDANTKKLLHIVEFPGSGNWVDKIMNDTPTPAGLCFHPDKPFLFVSNSNADKAHIISTITWKIVGTLSVGDIPDGIGFIITEESCD